MSIRNLTAAIILGLGTISSPMLISQAYAADMETQDLATQVKARIATLDNIMTQQYQRFIAAQNPNIDSISITTEDYTTTETGATATGKITIKFNQQNLPAGQSPEIVITTKDNIIYNDELTEQGILARINSELVINDSIKSFFDLDQEDENKIVKALEYVVLTTDLNPDGDINQTLQIKPFEFTEDGDKVQFDGFTLNTVGNESNLINGIGEMKLEFGKLTITSHDDAQAGQEMVAVLQPFNMDYALEDDGDLTFNSTPIKFENSEDNLHITIERMKGEGDDVHFNQELGAFTGKQEIVIDNISFGDDTMPSPIIIDSIHFMSEVKEDGDLYDFSNHINIDFNGESISKVFGMTGIEIEDIDIKGSFSDASTALINVLNYQFPAAISNEDEAQAQQAVQTLLNEMISHGSEIEIHFALNTDSGDATFVTDLKAKSDGISDAAKWQAAFEAAQPTALINLIQKSFDFDLKLTIPDSLIQATGMQGMMSMTAGYVVKDGSDYTLHLENSDDGIKLNGNILPLPQE